MVDRQKATLGCPCGFLGDERRRCRCTPAQITKYRGRLSGPMRDRIDLLVDVPPVTVGTITDGAPGESSAQVRGRVCAARQRQQHRGGPTGSRTNAELRGRLMMSACRPDAGGRAMLRRAVEKMGLTARGYDRVLRVARTIADLAGADAVESDHLAEALQYRLTDHDPVDVR